MAIGKDLEIILRAVDKFSVTFDKATAKIKKVTDKVGEAGKKLSDFGSKMTKFVTLPIVGLAGIAVKTAIDFEKLSTSFRTMLGSEEQATKLMKELTDFSKQTPLQLQDLAENAKLLLNFGTNVENVLPTLKILGDVSLGDQDKLNRLSLAFAQVQSQGRLMGQDLLQMINAGFNPLQIISEKTGKSMRQLKDEMSRGMVSARDVSWAFEQATLKGGRFHNALQAQSKTFAGQWSTFIDNVKLLAKSFGEILLPELSKFVNWLLKIVQWFQSLDEGTKKLIIKLALLAAAIGPVSKGLGGLMQIAGKLGPKGLIIIGIIAAITAAIVGIVAIIKNWDKVSKFFVDTWNNIVNAVKGAWEKIQEFANNFPNIILYIMAGLMPFIGVPLLIAKNWKGIISLFKIIGDKLKPVFKGIGNFFGGLGAGAMNIVKKVWEGLPEFFKGILEGIKKIFNTIVSAIKKLLGDDIIKGIKGVWEGLIKFLKDSWATVEGIINAIRKTPAFKFVFGTGEEFAGKKESTGTKERWAELKELIRSKTEIDVNIKTDGKSTATIGKMKTDGGTRVKAKTDNTIGNSTPWMLKPEMWGAR